MTRLLINRFRVQVPADAPRRTKEVLIKRLVRVVVVAEEVSLHYSSTS